MNKWGSHAVIGYIRCEQTRDNNTFQKANTMENQKEDTTQKFSSLAIGQEFDFVKPNSIYNSFFARCVKVSSRKYKSVSAGIEYEIGSTKAEVYNVVQ